MPIFHLSITDHRARPVRLYGVRDDFPRTESRDDVPRAITQRIDDRLHGPRQAAAWTTSGLTTIACLYMSMSLVPALMKSGLSVYVWVLITLIANVALFAGVALVVRWFVHRYYTGEIVAAFLGERRCPACGYDLAHGKADRDGFTVCPECGAAWKMTT